MPTFATLNRDRSFLLSTSTSKAGNLPACVNSLSVERLTVP